MLLLLLLLVGVVLVLLLLVVLLLVLSGKGSVAQNFKGNGNLNVGKRAAQPVFQGICLKNTRLSVLNSLKML